MQFILGIKEDESSELRRQSVEKMQKRRMDSKYKVAGEYNKRIVYLQTDELDRENEHKILVQSDEEDEIPFKLNLKKFAKNENSEIPNFTRLKATRNAGVRFGSRKGSIRGKQILKDRKKLNFSEGSIATHKSTNRNAGAFLMPSPKLNILDKPFSQMGQNGYMLEGPKITKIIKLCFQFKGLVKLIQNDLYVFKHVLSVAYSKNKTN